jgi:malate synthase
MRQRDFDQGALPDFLDRNSEMVKGDWKVNPLPPELLTRRVEITGPVNSAKMVINMLSRNDEGHRADMAMLDFEDSMKPSFENVLEGYCNVIGAVKGDLSCTVGSKHYQLNKEDMAYVMVRARGMHLTESNVLVDNEPISAGLLDLAVCFFHTAKLYLEQNKTPKYYIPKCEHHLEARWWNEIFIALQEALDIPVGTLKATFLIETLPAAFQVEEILYEIREHAAGLNVGRWDKIFSDIKVLRMHRDRIMGDRSSITMQKPWMENYAKRVIKICHTRGAFGMGGMSAFTPGKTPELREEQTRKVIEDKKREAQWGHDGCWVSHPYFIGPAMQAFKEQNQLHQTLDDFDKYSDIVPQGEGPYTLNGLRTNIRVGIAYMHGWNQDIGCVAFDNLMEDLATLESSRAQTWQWYHHEINLDNGKRVTKDLIRQLFMEEEARIYREFLRENRSVDPDQLEHDLKIARLDACELYLKKDLPDFLTLTSEAVEKKDNSEKDFEHGNAHEGIARSQTLLANGSSMERDQTGIHS